MHIVYKRLLCCCVRYIQDISTACHILFSISYFLVVNACRITATLNYLCDAFYYYARTDMSVKEKKEDLWYDYTNIADR